MSRLDGAVEVWGHVRDDGTVRAFGSREDCEAAGPVESIVVHVLDGWVYAATGRRFDPKDVIGVLSPARATVQTRDALTDAGITTGIHSVVSHARSGRMCTRLVLDKRWRQPGPWARLQEVLEGLPGMLSVELEPDREHYNYAFVVVYRRLQQ